MPVHCLEPTDYTIGWICALPIELAAAQQMLDEEHPYQARGSNDDNSYVLGRISGHNVVLACFPAGQMGTNTAAAVAARMQTTFTNVRFGLMVGIGGGVPSKEADIRLGDIVISQPQGQYGGVVQYDLGKTTTTGHERTGFLKPPPDILLNTLTKLRASHYQNGMNLIKYFGQFSRDNTGPDILFQANYIHVGESTCENCDKAKIVERNERSRPGPLVHYGTIASGNQVIKDGIARDRISAGLGNVLCYEMEGAGLMNHFPCLIIRGICDYSDSHKNKKWQPYAAATAAACAKEILALIPTSNQATKRTKEEAGNEVWMIPRNMNSKFTGREEQIREIQDLVLSHDTQETKPSHQIRYSITGMGGIGKSELCLKLADNMRNYFWAVFWVDVGTSNSALQQFKAIAEKLGEPAKDIDAALELLSNQRRPWLLILDNADNIEVDYSRFFPSGSFGTILITSRNPECEEYSNIGHVNLDGLDDENALKLFFQSSGVKRSPNVESQARTIVIDTLRCHTLAIIQAGAYIKKGYCTIENYVDILHGTLGDANAGTRRRRALGFFSPSERSRYGSVYDTFEVSALALQSSNQEEDRDAICLLDILSTLHFSPLSTEFFQASWEGQNSAAFDEIDDDSKLWDGLRSWHKDHLPGFLCAQSSHWDNYRLLRAVNILSTLALINRSPFSEHENLSLHPLIHLWARDRLSPENLNLSWVRAGSLIACSWVPYFYRAFLPQLETHIASFLEEDIPTIFSRGPDWAIIVILTRSFWYLDIPNYADRMQCILEEILKYLNAEIDTPTINLLPIYFHLGSVAHFLHNLSFAVQLNEKIVTLLEKENAKDPKSGLGHIYRFAQHELGFAYGANGQFRESIGIVERLVALRKLQFPETNPDLLSSQHELAYAYLGNGQVEEAIGILEHVVAIRERVLVKQHPYLLGSKSELCRAYLYNDQAEKCIELLEDIVELNIQTLSPSHPHYLNNKHLLGQAYLRINQVDQAIQLLQEVVKTRRDTGKDSAERLMMSELDLGRAYLSKNRVLEGLELVQHAFHMSENLPQTSPSYKLTIEFHLSHGLWLNNQKDEATQRMERIKTAASDVCDKKSWLQKWPQMMLHRWAFERQSGTGDPVVDSGRQMIEEDTTNNQLQFEDQTPIRNLQQRSDVAENGDWPSRRIVTSEGSDARPQTPQSNNTPPHIEISPSNITLADKDPDQKDASSALLSSISLTPLRVASPLSRRSFSLWFNERKDVPKFQEGVPKNDEQDEVD